VDNLVFSGQKAFIGRWATPRRRTFAGDR
jgi:hypothetical protein